MCRTPDKGNSKSFAKTTENEQWQDVKRAAKPKRSWRGAPWRSASASPLSIAVTSLAREQPTQSLGADEPRAPTRSGPAGVARAAPSARRPPMGKAAAYLAALQKRKEEVEAEEPSEQPQGGKDGRAKGKRPASTKRKKAAGPKKLTAREEKAA
ncbi:hypothetical protein PR001_g21379 [Phytophthora rubi]|uniref:Uncharacterized protein n=1 Tax=Phytophthora rubi TaxID=129364 RepID=A0A6A3JEP1_9STRA|nr:hypothetical protein PR001_g21379 [Phytophthora rubi]